MQFKQDEKENLIVTTDTDQAPNGGEEPRGPRMFLGRRATAIAGAEAGDDKISKDHLETAILALEAEVKVLRASAVSRIIGDLSAEMRAGHTEILKAIAESHASANATAERLLNTINGVRYMFELYAVRLSGGDLQEAMHEVNQLIDDLSKPIEVSKAEFKARRERERADGTLAAAEAVETEQVMQAIDGDPAAIEASSFEAREATGELER